MNNITYSLTEEIHSIGSHSRTSYGIAAYADAEGGDTSTVLQSIHDITSDKEKLQVLVQNCNRLKLPIDHLCDVVNDFLATDI